MSTITGKHLSQWGVPQGPVYGVILSFINSLGLHRKQLQSLIKDLLDNPHKYLTDSTWQEAAKFLLPAEDKTVNLNENGCPVQIFGEHMIEQGALDQIAIASRLPVSLQAACMPDGHQGYGLPIGGVLATDNAIIPYAVGVDIGCRMHMSITDIPFHSVKGMRDKIAQIIIDNTIFGIGPEGAPQKDHPVLSDERFTTIPILKKLRSKAVSQIGSSGGGNHFVNVGYVLCESKGITTPMLTILSHSGSRGVGAEIADFYTKLAMEHCVLPKEARHLAWFMMDSEEGREYWEAMNLAGDFAKANHEVLHARILKGLKAVSQLTIQNHHNFAWKEKITLADGSTKDAIVHRKGATPAGKDVIGIIPSSMRTTSYIVQGLGSSASINSSSHGSGRKMSRKHAKEQLTMSDMKKALEAADVLLIGGSLDESADAYKDIVPVMAAQKDLVLPIGEFTPWIVRMDEEHTKPWEKD